MVRFHSGACGMTELQNKNPELAKKLEETADDLEEQRKQEEIEAKRSETKWGDRLNDE